MTNMKVEGNVNHDKIRHNRLCSEMHVIVWLAQAALHIECMELTEAFCLKAWCKVTQVYSITNMYWYYLGVVLAKFVWRLIVHVVKPE